MMKTLGPQDFGKLPVGRQYSGMTVHDKLDSSSADDQPAKPRPQRIASVDALRGLTILLMVFVNDLGPAAPSWLHHIQPPDADGMTLADVVFPFFLFIAGVSIPLAIHHGRLRGQSTSKIVLHILTRTLGLLIMGLVGVNLWEQTSTDPQVWGLLSYISIILAWCIVPATPAGKRKLFWCLKISGIVGLVAMLAIYRREPVDTQVLFMGSVTDWVWLRTQWWGILGLIGWAYLVAACLYLALGHRREWLVAAAGLLMSSFVVNTSGGYFVRTADKAWLAPLQPALKLLQQGVEQIDQYVSLASQLGSLPAIVVSGCVLGSILLPDSDVQSSAQRLRWAATYAALLFIAGVLTDAYAGVNKIAATPSWCWWCASLATLGWVSLYWLMDVRHQGGWLSRALRPAGENPLIAYLLHPILLFIIGLLGLGPVVRGYASNESAWIVVLGSFVMAASVCLLTGLIARLGLRVRI